MLKVIFYGDYLANPSAYDLPRAMDALNKGDVVKIEKHDVYLLDAADLNTVEMVGVNLATTFQYGVALVAARGSVTDPQSVYVVSENAT